MFLVSDHQSLFLVPLLVLFGRDVCNPRALTLTLEFLHKYFGFFFGRHELFDSFVLIDYK